MAYATDADLQGFIPDILEYGVASFAPQLQMASDDVLEWAKLDWWAKAVHSRYGINRETTDFANYLSNFDVARLNTTALNKLTIYRAFHKYICPMLTSDSDEADAWARREERFKSFYDEELAMVKRMPLYDFDNDSSFTDIERRSVGGFRVIRA